MTWLTAIEYLRHKWPQICSTCRKHFFRSFSRPWLITGFVTRLTRRVPLVEQELLTLPEHLSSLPVFSGVRVIRSLVLYVCFVDHCLSFCSFSFGHRVVCSSSIYEFWLLLWYLKNLLIKILPQSSLEFSCYSIFLSYSMWHWRYLVYLWWFLLFQLICKIS
jgi:branched-subunit amino acid transport protein